MTNCLSIERSADLIKHGISANRATEIKVNDDPVSEWTHKGCPLFTITDLLSILPKAINVGHYYLDLSYGFGDWTASYIHWDSCDEGTYIRDVQGEKTSEELVDALYKLLLWCLENNHIKTN